MPEGIEVSTKEEVNTAVTSATSPVVNLPYSLTLGVVRDTELSELIGFSHLPVSFCFAFNNANDLLFIHSGHTPLDTRSPMTP